MTEPLSHPGYLRSSAFTIEILAQDRKDEETIQFSFDTFSIPERTTSTFDVIQGPGYPAMRFPGIAVPQSIEIDFTVFFERSLWRKINNWYEAARIWILPNLRDGTIIGTDQENRPQFKMDLFRLYPTGIRFTPAIRQPQRSTMAVTFFVWDYMFDDDVFEEYASFDEHAPPVT